MHDLEKNYKKGATLSITWEHNQDTMVTSLLCRAEVKASSYLCSDINLDSSLVGSASIYYIIVRKSAF